VGPRSGVTAGPLFHVLVTRSVDTVNLWYSGIKFWILLVEVGEVGESYVKWEGTHATFHSARDDIVNQKVQHVR